MFSARTLARSGAPAHIGRRKLVTSSTPRALAATSSAITSAESEKPEGSIASVFSSLGGDAFVPLEPRFLDLKKELFSDGLIESWRSVLEALEHRTAEICQVGNAVRPGGSYLNRTATPLGIRIDWGRAARPASDVRRSSGWTRQGNH